MNEYTPDERGGEEQDASSRDRLIARLIDASDEGLAAGDERVRGSWEELRALAAQDAGVWQDLAAAQYQHAALRGEVDRELAVVHRVDLPRAGEKKSDARGVRVRPSSHWRGVRPALLGSGWLAAASLALIWVAFPGALTNTTGEQALSSARMVNTTDDAIRAYLALGGQDGKVIGEVPDRSVVRWRRRESDGKIEAIMQRSFLERDILDDVYTVGRDELGRSVAVPVSYSGSSGQRR